jgi:hypothetical protein
MFRDWLIVTHRVPPEVKAQRLAQNEGRPLIEVSCCAGLDVAVDQGVRAAAKQSRPTPSPHSGRGR